MIQDHRARLMAPRALLVVQGTGLVLLTVFLFQILSGGKGLLILWAILAGVGAVWILQRPHWGVWILLTLWFVEISPALLGIRQFGIPKLLGALLLVPLALTVLRERGVWVLRAPQVRIFLALGILFTVSTGWSYFKYPVTLLPELDETGKMMQQFVTRLIFLVFFLYFIATRRRIEMTVWLILGLIAAAAATALSGFPRGGEELYRAQATFGMGRTSNYLAFLCVFGTSLLWFYRSAGQSRRAKILTLPLLFLLPATSLLTGSRNGFLVMALLTAFILYEHKDWSAAKRVGSLLFLGSIALVFLAVLPAAQLMRATTFSPSEAAAGQESLRVRINAISASLEMAVSNPILGIGIGNFRWLHQALYGNDREPHNAYLWALTSGGIGALVLYLFLFYTTYKMLRQLERSGPPELLWLSKGLRVNLILFLSFCAFGDLWLEDLLYWIVGLTLAMIRLWQHQDRWSAPIRSHPNLIPA